MMRSFWPSAWAAPTARPNASTNEVIQKFFIDSSPGCLRHLTQSRVSKRGHVVLGRPGASACARQCLFWITLALMGTVCWLPAALLGIPSVADSVPRSWAKSTTMIEQLRQGASELPHRLSAKKLPCAVPAPGVTDILERETGPVPAFFRVTVLYCRLNRLTLPNDTLDGVTLKCGAAGLTVIVQPAVTVPAGMPEASTTCAVKLNGPAVLGVPVSAPVVPFKARPAGKAPLVENVYGGTPPAAVRAELYA